MKFIKIPKKNGKDFRLICVPGKVQKLELKEILSKSLNTKQLQYCDKDIVFGALPGTNIVSNARKHIGFKFTSTFDLSTFFDTVTIDHVKEYLTEEEISKCFIDGHCYQGLPTSGAVSNLAAIQLDKDIKDFISTIDDKIVYTRYVDDLSISHDKFETHSILKDKIADIVAKNNFILNSKKIRLQISSHGRRDITGIYVDDKQIYTSRKFKKRLRASKHHENYSTKGLEEFSKLKAPHPLADKQIDNIYRTLMVAYNKLKFKNENHPELSKLKPLIDNIENIAKNKEIKKGQAKVIVLDHLKRNVINKEVFRKVSIYNK